MSSRSRRSARWARYLVPASLLVAIIVACGSPDPATNGDGTTTYNACSTPNDGCPCNTPGQETECGKVLDTSGDTVLCAKGKRTCVGGFWGTCSVDTVTTRNLASLSDPSSESDGYGIRPSALQGTGTPCPSNPADPLANACDPYCHHFVDNPIGVTSDSGALVVDGGLTVNPGLAIDGGGNPILGFNAGGDSTCAPGPNLRTSPCNAGNQFTRCQQDFHCNIGSGTCRWNGPEGWFDSAAGGVDLTVGAACNAGGTGNVPVCNRGSVAVPPNTILNVHVGGSSPLADSCTPGPVSCTRNVGSGGLLPGKCIPIYCPLNGNSYVAVSGATEAAGRCANNQAYAKIDGTPGCGTCNTCVTSLSGTIYDPRGVNPLPSVLVYVPSATPSAYTDGVACDTCQGLATGNPTTFTTTGYDGKFTLPNVPAGEPFNLVIMAGRWRRQVTVPAITACTTGTLAAASSTLPRNKAQGDIPKIALVSGAGDKLECLLRKIGIDDAEFTNQSGTGRIHLYAAQTTGKNGMTFSGATNGFTNLYGDASRLNSYSTVVAPCDNAVGTLPTQFNSTPPTHEANATQMGNIKAFLDAGGRAFASHWFAVEFSTVPYPTMTNNVYGARVESDREPPAFDFDIDQTFPDGKLFADWGNLTGASPSYGKVTFASWRHMSETVNAPTKRFAYGDSRNAPFNRTQAAAPATSTWGGPITQVYSFDTPIGGQACGRVVVPQSHVSTGSGTFPGGCGAATTAMTPQEKAFEFLFFNSQACLGLPPVAPPPPPPAILPAVWFVRDYEATCPTSTRPEWGYFFWQSNTPPSTSIQFYAMTSDTLAGLPGYPPPAQAPLIGTASGASVLAPNWAYDSGPAPRGSVGYHLLNDPPGPPQRSKSFLRIYMKFNPAGPIAPSLLAWRQQYSCKPAE